MSNKSPGDTDATGWSRDHTVRTTGLEVQYPNLSGEGLRQEGQRPGEGSGWGQPPGWGSHPGCAAHQSWSSGSASLGLGFFICKMIHYSSSIQAAFSCRISSSDLTGGGGGGQHVKRIKFLDAVGASPTHISLGDSEPSLELHRAQLKKPVLDGL